MRTAALIVALAVLPAGLAIAAPQKFFAYNMTSRTDFEGVYLAPAGTQNWGPNQALNDPDHSLDTTERLLLTGIRAGKYDVKLVDKKGRTCIAHNMDLTGDTSFELRDGDLEDCHP